MALLRWGLPAALALGLLAPLGCDEITRYRALSFFFDGVPPPPGVIVEKEPEPWEEGRTATRPIATRPTSGPAAETVASVHMPFQKRQCTECHSSLQSYQVAAEVESCRSCHPSYYTLKPDDWSHGPVAVGKCAMCHKGHKSEYPGLLTAPQPALCFNCHQASEVLSRPYHSQAQRKACSTCHDPHSAGNRHLLADSRTYLRRASREAVQSAPHAAWNKQECNRCHVPEHSNQLLPEVNKVCLSCHAKVQTPAPSSMPASTAVELTDVLAIEPIHEAVRQGQCTTCHTAHRSPRPHLERSTAEQMCFACHKLKEVQTDAHPRVNRVDCLLCHSGHHSPRKHLLREGVYPARARGSEAAASTAPATGVRP